MDAANSSMADCFESREPLIPHRYAWLSASTDFGKNFRPDLFDRDVKRLWEFGLNGVLLTPSPFHGTSIGREPLPFSLTDDGLTVDTETIRRFGDTVFSTFPQVDSLMFHSLECEWVWGNAVSIFPCRDNAVAERVFNAYLKGLTDSCAEHGKDLLFRTHVCSVSATQIRLMHQVLERYPSVVVMEDQNNCWPHAPVMGHLSPDIQQSVTKRRFGMSIDTTDGEYYGAGRLPTAYPEPHVRAARKAVELGAEYVFVRLNEQCRTPYDALVDNDFRTWQVNAHRVDIETFLSDHAEAVSAAEDALREIQGVKEHLGSEDYAYLSSCFEDALLMLDVVRVTAQAADACIKYHRSLKG